MRALKLISINAVVLLALIILADLILAIGFEARDYWLRVNDSRTELPNYAGQDWAKKHFEEHNALESTYRPYYGWRRDAFEGETITIGRSGLRRTLSAGDGHRIGFFGGSTMWGTGAGDHETIPSFVAQKLGVQAVNFGEAGWRAHQSLNQLIEVYIAGETFDVVVFYDGANEVEGGCRTGLEPFSHTRGAFIAERLESTPLGYEIRAFIGRLQRLTTAIARRLKLVEATTIYHYDCARDSAKAEFIARMLAADWDIARFIANRMGAQFIGVLQPISYFSETPLDHLILEGPWEAEYNTVYPLIREAIEDLPEREKLDFIDMTPVLDTEDRVYIDWFHLSPNGNEIVADHLSDHIRKILETTLKRDREGMSSL